MSKWIYAILAAPILLSIVAFNLDTTPRNTAEVIAQTENGVVYISNQIDTANGGIGTGFIVDKNTIITNHHVIDGNGKITVYMPNSGKKYEAEVAYKDPVADLAIIRVKDWDTFEKEQTPAILSFDDSDETPLGSKVIVLGHPWGLSWSASEGIISGKNRRLGQNPKYMDQVDAHLYQGNSGGPILNEKGKIICVSDMMLALEGGSYGFCLPSNFVKKVIHDFNTLGEVRWRALNVSIGLTDDGSNVILQSVEVDGAAGKAGLVTGDKVLSIVTPNNHPSGKKVTSVNDLITELAKMYGDREVVKLIIERNGQVMSFDVKTSYKLSKDYTPDKGK